MIECHPVLVQPWCLFICLVICGQHCFGEFLANPPWFSSDVSWPGNWRWHGSQADLERAGWTSSLPCWPHPQEGPAGTATRWASDQRRTLSFTMSLGHVSSSKPIACAMPRASRFSKCSISRFSHGHVMFSSQNSRNIVLVRFGLWLARLGKFNGQVAVGRLVTPETCLDTLLSVTSSPRMLWYSLRSGTW